MSDERFLQDCLRWSVQGLRYEATKSLVDDIHALESERDKLKAEVKNLQDLLQMDANALATDRDFWREQAGTLAYYAVHEQYCSRNHCSAGRPTKDGGYEFKYKDKWYESRPVDRTPKCECGLDSLLEQSKL